MANEGFLGTHVIGGERVATGDHPPVILHLPVDEDLSGTIDAGTVMKRVDVTETEGETSKVVGAAWTPLLSTDTTAVPVAVIDSPCDTGTEKFALCLVHGGVKARMLKTGDGKALSEIQIAVLAEHGIFAV